MGIPFATAVHGHAVRLIHLILWQKLRLSKSETNAWRELLVTVNALTREPRHVILHHDRSGAIEKANFTTAVITAKKIPNSVSDSMCVSPTE